MQPSSVASHFVCNFMMFPKKSNLIRRTNGKKVKEEEGREEGRKKEHRRQGSRQGEVKCIVSRERGEWRMHSEGQHDNHRGS